MRQGRPKLVLYEIAKGAINGASGFRRRSGLNETQGRLTPLLSGVAHGGLVARPLLGRAGAVGAGLAGASPSKTRDHRGAPGRARAVTPTRSEPVPLQQFVRRPG